MPGGYALAAARHMYEFGTTSAQLAEIKVAASVHAQHNPHAFLPELVTVEEVLESPMISDPICRFDCDIPVDGVATFVLTTAERARDLPHPPVYVAGYASGAPTRARLHLHWPLDDVVEVYRDPAPATDAPYGWTYRSVERRDRRASISPLASATTPFTVADFLP